MLIIYSLVEGTIHFVAIHQRWLGKCLKRTLQKRLHDIINFCSRIIISRHLFQFTSSHTLTSHLPTFRFGGYRQRWENNLKLRSVPNRNTKGFKMYCPLLWLHSYFSIWSIFTSYALTQKESFRSKLSTIRTFGGVTLILMTKGIKLLILLRNELLPLLTNSYYLLYGS